MAITTMTLQDREWNLTEEQRICAGLAMLGKHGLRKRIRDHRQEAINEELDDILDDRTTFVGAVEPGTEITIVTETHTASVFFLTARMVGIFKPKVATGATLRPGASGSWSIRANRACI